ncbi:MAG: serine hydrolase [Acidobacteriota bacterium]
MMQDNKKLLVSLGCLLAVTLGVGVLPAWGQEGSAPGDLPESKPQEQGIDRDLLEAAYAKADAIEPLRSLLVARNGHLVSERYFRGADRSTLFNIKSVSKSFLSGLTGIAIKKGFLKGIDQPVSEILPEYFESTGIPGGVAIDERLLQDRPLTEIIGEILASGEVVDPADIPPWHALMRARADTLRQKLTIRHLLTMTTGHAWVENAEPWTVAAAHELSSDWNRFFLELPFAARPGEKFIYTTAATHVLSTAIARATTMSTKAFADKHLFGPLGIKVKRWDTDFEGNHYGGSEMYFTARDMMKYGVLYANDGSWKGTQIIPAEWVHQSTSQQIGVDSDEHYTHIRDTRPEISGYGFLWWLRKSGDFDTYIGWGYGGQFIICVPDLDLVVVATANFMARAGVQVADGVFELLDNEIIPSTGEQSTLTTSEGPEPADDDHDQAAQ